MIRYSLICEQDHQFESWFQSAAAFDKLAAAGHVACTICGSGEVKKTLMAPPVNTQSAERKPANALPVPGGASAPVPAPPAPMAPAGVLSQPNSDIEAAVTALRQEIERSSEDVGDQFVSEARKMHLGETEKRAIYGEAKLQEAKTLLEEGIPVVPLPFRPTRKTN